MGKISWTICAHTLYASAIPILLRFFYRSYMVSMNWWGDEQEENLKRDARLQVLQAVKQAGKTLNSNMKDFFTDVYDVMPRHLAEQYDEFAAHIRKYPTEYPIDNFSKR